MEMALALARRALGRVNGSAAVGCVIVKKGEVLGRGWTQAGGRPHAEAEALKRAGHAAKGADCYVTLEPCAHKGRGPACAGLLEKAGIKRLFVAVADPDPRTRGKSITSLREHGIKVAEGLLENEARDLNVGYFKRMLLGTPFVTLKVAASADGKIAPKDGRQAWITGEEARAFGHRLRATHDALITGIGTVAADDPDLTCRLPGCEGASPIRIVLDTRLRLKPNAKMLKSAKRHPVWIVSEEKKLPAALAKTGVTLITVESTKDIGEVLKRLAQEGVSRLLVEAGSRVNASFLASGFVDEIAWFCSKVELGEGALPAVHGKPSVTGPAAIRGFEAYETKALGADMLHRLRPNE
jgi:diaminohydroxyphosphoribosylaminopyrimidine deaminase / 5-amino-6-(5-phosphoribosylamino)uracil reductase